jgi:hypothetical protein
VESTRKWAGAMKAKKLNYKCNEIAGGDHGSVIATGMPAIFAFFKEHIKH